MAYLLLASFLLAVAVLTTISARRGAPAQGCCAPAEPARDLRMRGATDDTGPA